VNNAVRLGIQHCLRREAEAVLILPVDIPLISVGDVEAMVRLGNLKPSIVISPSLRFNGTNALLLHPPNLIETSYEKDSFRSHLKAGLSKGLKVKVYLSLRVMLDLDLPQDLKHFLRLKASLNTETYRFASRLRLMQNDWGAN